MSFRSAASGTWKVTKFLGRSLRNTLAIVGVATAGSVYFANSVYRNIKTKVPQELGIGVLDLDLTNVVVVEKEPSPREAFLQAVRSGGRTKPKVSLQRLVSAIDRAATDPRVTALVARCDESASASLGLAAVKDIRDALVRFRTTTKDSKPTVFYTDTFGELMGNATSLYYLATACEDIRMQPSGSLGFKTTRSGWNCSRVQTRYEYKNAPNTFTETQLTAYHREQLEALCFPLFVEEVAEMRYMSSDKVQDLMNSAPLTCKEALDCSLVDGVSYYPEIIPLVKEKVKAKRNLRAAARRIIVDECLSAAEQLQKTTIVESENGLEKPKHFVESCLRLIELCPWEMKLKKDWPFNYKEWMFQRQLLENLDTCLVEASQMTLDELKNRREKDEWFNKYLKLTESMLKNTSTVPFMQMKDSGLPLFIDIADIALLIVTNMSATNKDIQSDMEDSLSLKKIYLRDYMTEMKIEESIQQAKDKIERIRKQKSQSKPSESNLPTSPSAVAMIYLVGNIVRDDSSGGSRRLLAALDRAVKDDSVGAIILRISSPGGSYVASDTIHRAVQIASQVKPVIASLGDIAASGGYFSAIPCSPIVAQPTSVTGSIGAFTFRFVFKELADKMGVQIQSPFFGKHSASFSGSALLEDWDEEFQKKADKFLDMCYEDFVEKVSKGRHLDLEYVHKIARGRIWSGLDALKIGLVDLSGGIFEAMQVAKQLGNIPRDVTPYIKEFSIQPTLTDKLSEYFGLTPPEQEWACIKQPFEEIHKLSPRYWFNCFKTNCKHVLMNGFLNVTSELISHMICIQVPFEEWLYDQFYSFEATNGKHPLSLLLFNSVLLWSPLLFSTSHSSADSFKNDVHMDLESFVRNAGSQSISDR
eukprot:jgi/Galph1/2275/GphlegSOOS_G947.1